MNTAAMLGQRGDAGAAALRLSSINLRAFEIFVDVVECGNMSMAAVRLGISQSAVSQAIQGFEQSLGQTLFDRTLRPPALTLAGRAVLHHALEIVGHARSLERAGSSASGQMLPLLRMGMANTFAVTVAPRLLKRVRHLARSWVVTSGPTETRIEGLAHRRVDFIATFDEASAKSEFLVLPVMSEPYCIAVPKDFLGKVSKWTDVTDSLDMLRYGSQLYLSAQIESFVESEGINAPAHYRFDSIDAVIAMVAAGLGWALVTPLGVLKSASLAKRLRFLPLPGRQLRRSLVIAGRRDDAGTTAEQLQQAAIKVVRDERVPELRRLLPGIGEHVTVAEEITSGADGDAKSPPKRRTRPLGQSRAAASGR